MNSRLNSKLDYCDGYKKSIDDLYNPLVLAFKILKRGFCLVKENHKKKDEEEKNEEIPETNNTNEYNFDQVLPKEPNLPQYIRNEDYYNSIFFNAPIMLPSGICLFDAYPIRFLQDYEVTCSYNKN